MRLTHNASAYVRDQVLVEGAVNIVLRRPV